MVRALLKREVSKQFLKFCVIGFGSTVFNYLIFLVLLHFLSVNYLLSAGTGFLSGAILGFIFNKIYTFNSTTKSSIAAPLYFTVYTFSLCFHIVSLKLLVDGVGINPLISNAFVLVITTLINFFGTKILVFKNKKW